VTFYGVLGKGFPLGHWVHLSRFGLNAVFPQKNYPSLGFVRIKPAMAVKSFYGAPIFAAIGPQRLTGARWCVWRLGGWFALSSTKDAPAEALGPLSGALDHPADSMGAW
jgi:hypothetical protein